MLLKITLQYLTEQKIIQINQNASVENLSAIIELNFNIKSNDQILTFNDRNINIKHKKLSYFGISDGSKISIRKINRIEGGTNAIGLHDMMKNPYMKSMLKDPELLKNIMGDNSTIKDIVKSGGLEEEIEKMAQGSEYTNTQLRNVDLALARLENMPGGMNMMSNMIKDIENPIKNLLSPVQSIKSTKQIKTEVTSSLPGHSKVNPLIDYREQNKELIELGFTNIKDNLEALVFSKGDLNVALEYLGNKYE